MSRVWSAVAAFGLTLVLLGVFCSSVPPTDAVLPLLGYSFALTWLVLAIAFDSAD